MTVAARGGQTAGGRSITPTEKKPGGDVASQTNTATFTGPAFNTEDAIGIDAQLNVTAASGTSPTLALALQSTLDGVNWYVVGTLPTVSATGSTQQSLGGSLGVQCRWVATIGGTTPSFTWNVDHQARRVL